MNDEKDFFNEDGLVSNNWVKFSVVGDNIFGTLVAVREAYSTLPDKKNELQKNYEIKAAGGEFHDTKNKKIIEPAVKIQPGEFWFVGGGFMIDGALRNVKIGTKIAIKFTGEKPNKISGYDALKIKNVWVKKGKDGLPEMDEEFLAERNKPEE